MVAATATRGRRHHDGSVGASNSDGLDAERKRRSPHCCRCLPIRDGSSERQRRGTTVPTRAVVRLPLRS